jgi:putative ABC transport system ATP-binding protein
MIRLRGIELTLASSAGPVHILRGVDLDVAAGTSLSVVGPSGSGKSSLLAIIGGIERPTGGTVEVAGTDLATLDEDGLALFRRRRVGVLFQSFHLIPTMTALENVALPLELAGRRDAFPRARDGLAEVGLGQRFEHYPAQLSGGEQQRVALARALANEPELLLADEPTGNLDRSTGRQIAELIFAARERHGATLFLITHDPALASLCDETRRMSDGRLDDARVHGGSLVGAAS